MNVTRTNERSTMPALPKCLYGKAPTEDCGARACPIHGTPSASPYGKRQGAREEN